MTGSRPWRAVAFLVVGDARITVARTARASEEAVLAWVHDQRDRGYATDHWQIRPIPEVQAALR